MKTKHRVMILTDISSLQADHLEPDDTQSLVRFLLYANEFDIEGLIATAYGEHGIKPEYIETVIGAYAKVHQNLLKHDPAYPSPAHLLSLVQPGSEKTGMDQLGEEKDTKASQWIIHAVDKQDDRPLWILLWGGPLDLAQAIWKVCHTRSHEEALKFKAKIRVHAIGDQYDGTGPWLKANHPDLFYITSQKTFRGMYRGGEVGLTDAQWVRTHVCQGHGPLGALYPVYNGGDPFGKVSGIKEGDTPSFLYLIPNGLNDPENPSFGGWGGRFEGSGKHYTDAEDTLQDEANVMAGVARWRPAYQADFQARMDWCQREYNESSHPPVVVSDTPSQITLAPGQTLQIDASRSYDPNAGKLGFHWEHYKEPSGYKGPLQMMNSSTAQVTVTVPATENPGSIHILLSVSLIDAPYVTRYQRYILLIS